MYLFRACSAVKHLRFFHEKQTLPHNWRPISAGYYTVRQRLLSAQKGIFYLPKGIWTNYDYADDAGVRIYTLMEGNPTESVVYNINRETDFIVTGTSIRTERNEKSLLLPLPEWKSNLKHNDSVSHYVMIIFI